MNTPVRKRTFIKHQCFIQELLSNYLPCIQATILKDNGDDEGLEGSEDGDADEDGNDGEVGKGADDGNGGEDVEGPEDGNGDEDV